MNPPEFFYRPFSSIFCLPPLITTLLTPLYCLNGAVTMAAGDTDAPIHQRCCLYGGHRLGAVAPVSPHQVKRILDDQNSGPISQLDTAFS